MATLPPGPKAPSLWQSARFLTRPLEFFQEQVDTYGSTFTIRLAGAHELVILTTPSDIRALFTAPVATMHAGVANARVFDAVVGSRGHFVLEEESHLARRRLMLPPFHGERMHEYGEAMADVTSRAVATWPRERPFAAHPQLQRITLQVILRTLFGLDDATPRDEAVMRQLVRLADEALASPLLVARPLRWDLGPWSPWGRVRAWSVTRTGCCWARSSGDGKRGMPPSARTSFPCSCSLGTTRAKGSPTPSGATSWSPWCWRATRRRAPP